MEEGRITPWDMMTFGAQIDPCEDCIQEAQERENDRYYDEIYERRRDH